jgi:hypothetical protein
MKTKSSIPAVIPAPSKPAIDRQDAALDSLPESKRWDPAPSSAGRQTPESPGEDDEARNESAQLVEDGVEAAGRDQVAQSSRADENKAGIYRESFVRHISLP